MLRKSTAIVGDTIRGMNENSIRARIYTGAVYQTYYLPRMLGGGTQICGQRNYNSWEARILVEVYFQLQSLDIQKELPAHASGCLRYF